METSGPDPNDRFLGKYAIRLARLCFLRYHCSADHPILSSETQLMDMARSKLQEELLTRVSVDTLKRMQGDLEFEIRQMAKDWVSSHPMEKDARTSILEDVDGEDLSRLFLLDS